jgi:hypothetical protein
MSTTATKLQFDPREAKRFLDVLCDGDCRKKVFTFQTFSDGKNDGALAKTWSDTFSRETAADMERLNKAGAGIFVTANETDGQGRKNKNVTAVRAPFVDLDGSPIEPVHLWYLKPYIIVESSPNRYHAYWRHDGSIKLEDFKQLQLDERTYAFARAREIPPRIVSSAESVPADQVPSPLANLPLAGTYFCARARVHSSKRHHHRLPRCDPVRPLRCRVPRRLAKLCSRDWEAPGWRAARGGWARLAGMTICGVGETGRLAISYE